jgi:hypothetical protein
MAISWSKRKGDGIGIRFTHTPSLTGSLEHWQQDTFVARWDDRSLLADAYLTFSLNPGSQSNAPR